MSSSGLCLNTCRMTRAWCFTSQPHTFVGQLWLIQSFYLYRAKNLPLCSLPTGLASLNNSKLNLPLTGQQICKDHGFLFILYRLTILISLNTPLWHSSLVSHQSGRFGLYEFQLHTVFLKLSTVEHNLPSVRQPALNTVWLLSLNLDTVLRLLYSLYFISSDIIPTFSLHLEISRIVILNWGQFCSP